MGKLLGTWWGRLIMVGLVILGVSYAAKLAWQEASTPAEVTQRAEVGAALDGVGAALEAWRKAQPEGAPALPEGVDWTPSRLDCGQMATVDPKEAAHPTWAALGLDLGKPSPYQLRFRQVDKDRFELLARTDEDCDGLHQVHRLTGRLGWGTSVDTHYSLSNPGE